MYVNTYSMMINVANNHFLTQSCNACGKEFKWQNQEFIGRLPVLNLLISAALYFSGACTNKVLRMYKYLKVCSNLHCIFQINLYGKFPRVRIIQTNFSHFRYEVFQRALYLNTTGITWLSTSTGHGVSSRRQCYLQWILLAKNWHCSEMRDLIVQVWYIFNQI